MAVLVYDDTLTGIRYTTLLDATVSKEVGRSRGHQWAVFLATSGQFYWPPTGSFPWPLTFWRSVIVECKNYNAPLVVIGRGRAETRLIRTFSEFAASRQVVSPRDKGSKSGLGVSLGVRSLPASAELASFIGSQVVRLEHKGSSYSASNAGLMESLFVPVAKAMWSEQRELTIIHDSADSSLPMQVVISFPIVVTSKPVFEADVTGGSTAIREVPWTTVFRRFHRKAEDDDVLPESVLLEIVSRDGLTEYLDKRADAFTAQIGGVLEAQPELWMPTAMS